MKIITLILFLICSFTYGKTVLLTVSFNGAKFNIDNIKIINKDFPNSKVSFDSKENIYFHIKNKKNKILENCSINNPRILRIPFPKDKNNTKHHTPIILQKGSFLIRFKYHHEITKIEIIDGNSSQILVIKSLIKEKNEK